MAASAFSGKLPSLAGSDWLIRPETRAVFAALAARGFEARAVGGAVRNALLGRPVVDIDIATPATPQEVIAAAEAAGLTAVPTGIAHGTVTVVANHVPYEVTTLREDVETHGRHATVAFTDDWAADARRRDFTLNALYCSAEGEVFDPLSGYADLAARRVRFIGDARERIREDYLRILRFFRLTAEYGDGPPDAEGLAACVREREGLARLSAERVREELLRLLVAPRGPELIRWMLDYGLLTLVLAAAPRPALLERLAAIEAGLGLSADAILRLAALVVEVGEDADRLRDRLRLSNEEHARLARVGARAPDIGPAEPEQAARAYLYTDGAPAYRDRALMSSARSGAAPDVQAWRRRYALHERWQPPRFPLKGDDVMAFGIPAGPRVGKLLRAVEAWWIAGDFVADETALRAKLRELVDQA
ncbi:MAG TPA: CCA tRNA nucleotidyltransferase [Hyphomicrobiaceae bacterium]|nr:CCA tRNA nucleotidyltransferase [Hyphomicrobiaceae bacterium]